jgi:hypothetical protein
MASFPFILCGYFGSDPLVIAMIKRDSIRESEILLKLSLSYILVHVGTQNTPCKWFTLASGRVGLVGRRVTLSDKRSNSNQTGKNIFFATTPPYWRLVSDH